MSEGVSSAERPAEEPVEPVARLVAPPPEVEAQRLAEARTQWARATLTDVDEGWIHRPTRAEATLAAMWAAVLAPLVAAPIAGIAEVMLGTKALDKLAATLGGHRLWPLMVGGTVFFALLLAQLFPKARSRRISEARVLVFERGRSFGPRALTIVLLVELGIFAAALSR